MSNPSIHSIIDFVDHALNLRTRPNETVVFRGHSDLAYKNTPSVLRSQKLLENEHLMLRELVSLHPEEFLEDRTALELLVRAQHYGLPTRLLDVTFNPLAALFFACEKEWKTDGEVVAFIANNSRIKQYDSDTVSCLANFAFLSHKEKKNIKLTLNRMIEETKFSDRDEVRKFRNITAMKRVLHFIRQEKPHFQNKITPPTLRQFIVALPKRSNRRISAQTGAFIVFGCYRTLNDNVSPQFRTQRFTIPAKYKERLCGHLSKLSINEPAMFPEIDRTAQFLNYKYS